MDNIVQKVKSEITEIVTNSIEKAIKSGLLNIEDMPSIEIEEPKEKQFGDLSINTAMVMAKSAKMPPRKIAEIIKDGLKLKGTLIDKVEIAGPGFMNFYLSEDYKVEALKLIKRKGSDYGRVNIGNGKKVQVEFVSANPTGPMHMGNARGGALGDALSSILDYAGYDVTREFYINDAGNQIEKFGLSLEARYLELLGEHAEVPEGGYHGDDIIERAKEFLELYGDKYKDAAPEDRRKALVQYGLKKNIEKLKEDLEAYGIEYDVWFSENTLHESGEVESVIDELKEKGYTYEKDGALWFKETLFGAEKDDVLVRANGYPTYLASDIAYHKNKFVKRGFDWVIDIWGADHHGHVAPMKGAMKALGIDPDKLDVLLMQLVRLMKGKEVVKMSKRTGKMVTLRDLIDEVGKDAARFFFNMRSADSAVDFDMDLAVEQSNENPVFYVQYAHARICSIIRQLKDDGINTDDLKDVDLNLLNEEAEIDLIKKLAYLPEEVTIAAKTMAPHRITRYILDVASLFHTFYNSCRVRGVDEELMKARIVLIDSTRIVIKNVLDMLKITAPEKM
ncbi:arginyl-tRNA synthetase [Thermoanaerobacterium thermosaccharolyticum DSM 571]|uniref:Arginine--tRNA ligase n=1 Tax=Thermoanaerobacterium thermosaccharolyticum (strain ATCC 7956 / DSM 571 / NCIMB 9385 / NCA 3814 / NCTC 13789 / WDCM 00135 / 2032) TaxID=580327 RepID=D9TPL4_THETC|nr:arginine--tRNA ligase [Thermoanaerobacterium thermosaccharolyticum]ADL67796.1 arginyl-tRNA synthetase [Thermoanaerobacterium thermosaccharolyticum DSM 571]